MAAKSRRKRHGRAPGRPAPRRLDDDLRRHQLAREIVPQMIEGVDDFLEYFPQIARRRVGDRISVFCVLASEVLAWSGLAAPRDDDHLPARCFASACFLSASPAQLNWQALAMSGMGAEVRTRVRGFASEATGLPTERPDPDWLRQVAESVPDEVRAFKERLAAQDATSADGRRLGSKLLYAALALDRAPNGEFSNLTVVGAIGLLDRTLPTDAPGVRVELGEIAEGMAAALPGILEGAVALLEQDAESEPEDDDEPVDPFDLDELEEEEDGPQPLPSLEDILDAYDSQLSVTEEPGQGAELAYEVAVALLFQCAQQLPQFRATFEAGVRGIAAADAMLLDSEGGPAPLGDDLGAAVEMVYLRSAALLEADLPEAPGREEPVDVQLSCLDDLVDLMQHVAAEEELAESPAGALALLGGAVQTLRAGIALGHPDADTKQRMAAALGVLDPLALADFPEVRAQAAQHLRDVARSRRLDAASSGARN